MNIHWCRNEAERLWWLHRENAMWWDELRASLLVIMASLKADLRKQDPRSQQFKEGLNSLKKKGYCGRISMRPMSGKTMMGWMLGV